MWPNNSFGGNGSPFPNKFNQEDFQYSQPPFGVAPDQSMTAQPLFHPQQSDDINNGQSFMGNVYQPEIGAFNQRAFMQNQFSPSSNSQFSDPPPNVLSISAPISTPTPNIRSLPTPQINARAAELKAQLLRSRENRESSATPPVKSSGPTLAARQKGSLETSSSLRQSPKIQIVTAEKREQECNLDELISQFSDTKRATDKTPKEELKVQESNTNSQHPQSGLEPAKSQAPLPGSPTKVAELIINGKQVENNQNGKNYGKHHNRKSSSSDASEGEIVENREPANPIATTKPKEAAQKVVPPEENAPPKPQDSNTPRPSINRTIREPSPPRRLPPATSTSQIDRKRDDSRDDVNGRSDRRYYQSEYRHERKHYVEPERQPPSRRESRDDDYRRTQNRGEETRAEDNHQNREQKSTSNPSLIDLLPHDDDLREWLEITGYNNTSYRNKILGSRRELAKLDAQREKVVAEMQAAARGDLPFAIASNQSNASMLPPRLPENNTSSRAEQSLTISGSGTDSIRDRVVSNKRPHSDFQDTRDEYGSSKLQRIEDRAYNSRNREEEDFESRRPRSNGYDNTRRSSFDRRDDIEPSRLRFDGRAKSREREFSPNSRSYESRPSTRVRPYETDSYYNRDEFNERGSRGAFEIRGGYKGRSFDPNFRGRGRGRGRGDTRDSPEPRGEAVYGSRIANGKPYKDPDGFQKGSRGDTRYFIVKSFNEENVLRCMEDSVWTTQVQNGPVFKEAFETCRNVILVFSINKSRAFQGYARMESLPGAIDTPEWQKQINWESAGAFKVKWLVIYSTRFHLVGHLKNRLNENQAVLIGKDGQEIEEECGANLIDLIDNEATMALADTRQSDDSDWEVHY